LRAALPTIERDILQRIEVARVRLRFDKVVLRFVGQLQNALINVVPDGEAVIFTVAAPIRLPAKTATVLEGLVRDGLPYGESCQVIQGNGVRVRRLRGALPQAPKVLGFVHNPTTDSAVILALTESGLLVPRR
jgi:hypothetical protein